MMMNKQRIFIAGHQGMVGSAITRRLKQRDDVELVLRTRDELNLLDSSAVLDFFSSTENRPGLFGSSKSRRYFS